jgi:peptide/nickel transport system substrate-binding protein
MKPRGLLNSASMNRRKLLAHTGGAAVLAGAAAAPMDRFISRAAALQQSPTPGGILVRASGGPEPDTLDPHLTGYHNTMSFAMHVLDTLVRQDENYEFHPNLADRWEANDDATTYTFHLREGVRFHDGTPFNGEAVQVNFDRIVDPSTLSRMAITYLGPYSGTEVVDDLTVRVHFSSPFPNFLAGAARALLGFMSPTALEELGNDIGRQPVGTGAFRFAEWEAGRQILFTRNDEYAWGSPAFQHEGPPLIDGFRTEVLVEPATALAAFDAGEVHWAPLPALDVPNYIDNPDHQILSKVYAGFPRSAFINVEKPPTDDIRVRQACIHAVNQQAIIDISFAGLISPAHGPLASTTLGYDPSVEEMYPYDPERAGALLDEAGWAMGSGGFREKDGERLTLITIVNQGWDPYIIPVQAMMRDVGIDMQIQTLSSAARVEANALGEGNLAPLGVDSSDPRVLEVTFHSSSIEEGWAWSRFQDETLDALLDSAASEIDPEVQLDMYRQIQQIIMENALIIPLVENTYFHVLTPEVHGVVWDVDGFPWFHGIWLEQ